MPDSLINKLEVFHFQCWLTRLSRNYSLNLQFFPVLLCIPEIILGLLIHPAFSRSLKVNRKSHSHIRTNPGTSIHNCAESLSAYTKRLYSFSNWNTQRLRTKLPNDFSGVRGVMHKHGNTSMIIFVIHDFGIVTREFEGNPPISTNVHRSIIGDHVIVLISKYMAC